jgi:hypothetical protein
VIIVVLVAAVGVVLIAAPRHPAEKVVADMYDALVRSDMNAYMDAILPENRRVPNPWGALGALRVTAGPVGLDIGKLTQLALRDLRTSMVNASGDYALVKAEGYLRLPALSLEVRFCDEHDVRLRDGRWYVDVFAPERTARVQRYQQQLLADLQNAPTSSSGDVFTDMLGALSGPQLERAANFCVD